MHLSQPEDYSEKIISTLLQHCRVKYAPCFSCVPHIDIDFCKNISRALRTFNSSQTEKGSNPWKRLFIFVEGKLQVDPLSCVSGAAVLPMEFNSAWTSEQVVLHASSRLAALIEEVYVENIESIGEMFFGVAHHESKGYTRHTWVGVGVGWRSATLHRRYLRNRSGAEVSLRNLSKHLQKELCNLRLKKGLDAKFSEDFSSTLELELPKHFTGDGLSPEKISNLAKTHALELPPYFTSYALEVLHFESSVTADAVLDCCIDTMTDITCDFNPKEFDVHIAVAVIPWKRKDGSLGTCAVGVSRLWRDRPEVKDNLPPQIKSSLLEKLLRERICVLRGMNRKSWDVGLSTNLQKAYATNDLDIQLSIPNGYSWFRHAAFTFHGWSIKAVINYLGKHRFWNAANDVVLADASEIGQPVKYALSILPADMVKNTTHLQQKDLAKSEESEAAGSFTVVLGIVWRESVKSTSVTRSKPEVLSTDYLDSPNVEKLFISKEKPQIEIEPSMSSRHYNLPPTLLSLQNRECLWPSKITSGLYLSGEIPACNRSVLEDYGITHVVVCGSHSCLFSSDYHYLKLNMEIDLKMQIESVYAFITASSPSNEINLCRVLVHGVTGNNHSASVLIGFLMQKNRQSLDSVFNFVYGKRSSVNISDTLWRKLTELEQLYLPN